MKASRMTHSIWYEIPVVPACDGDWVIGSHVSNVVAIGEANKRLLQEVAAFPGITVSLIYDFRPEASGAPRRTQLHLYLRLTARNKGDLVGIKSIVERGSLNDFYKLRPCEPPSIRWGAFKGMCDVVRPGEARRPSIEPEENWRIPTMLYEDRPVQPESENTYADLDHLMYGHQKRLVVHMCIESASVAEERMGLDNYASALGEANHGYDGSFQTPRYASWREDASIGRRTQLSPPRKRDGVVDDVLRAIQTRARDFSAPQLLFHCRILGDDSKTVLQVANTVGKSAYADGTYALVPLQKRDPAFAGAIRACKAGFVGLVPTAMRACVVDEPALHRSLERLPQLGSPEELTSLCRLPTGTPDPSYCIRQSTDPPDIPEADLLIMGHDRHLAAHGCTGPSRGIPKKDLAKSVAFFGMPGSGKSVALANLMFQLYMDGVPFIMIAPILTEHMAIKLARDHPDPRVRDFARNLRVYTPGRDGVSPFTMPFLQRPPWVSVDQHVEELMECFRGSTDIFEALDGVLQQALREIYQDFPDPDVPPTMDCLVDRTVAAVAERGYEGEILSNLRAAIDVRLRPMCQGSIGSVFNSTNSCPGMGELTNSYTLIDLEALPEQEKARFTLLFMKSLREHIANEPITDRYLRLALIVDEAHLIAPPPENGSTGENMNPGKHATAIVGRCMREWRKHRVALAVADQSPQNVAPDVIRLAGSKLGFRTVDAQDRQTLASAMLLSPENCDQLARLEPGEAFLFAGGYQKPRLIRTVRFHEIVDITKPVTYEDVLPYIADEPWYRQARETIERERLLRLVSARKAFEIKQKAISQCWRERQNPEDIAACVNEGRLLHDTLKKEFGRFRESYERLIGKSRDTDSVKIQQLRNNLRNAFEKITVPGTNALLQCLLEPAHQLERSQL